MIIAAGIGSLGRQRATLELEKERALVRRRYGKSVFIDKSHFGNIYRVFEPLTNEPVVIKMVSKAFRNGQVNVFHGSEAQVFENPAIEEQLLEASRVNPHPNVAAAASPSMALDTPSHVALTMKHYNGGDLFSFLQKRGRVSPLAAVRLVGEVLKGVKHLHQVLGHSHNDISLENVLLHFDKPGSPLEAATPVLIDFGLACPLHEAPTVLNIKPNHRAPELYSTARFQDEANASRGLVAGLSQGSTGAVAFGPAVVTGSDGHSAHHHHHHHHHGAGDVYSCGMLLFYLITGLVVGFHQPLPGDKLFRLFRGPQLQAVIHQLSGQNARSRVVVPACVCNLIRYMTRATPTARVSVDTALDLTQKVIARLSAQGSVAAADPALQQKRQPTARAPPATVVGGGGAPAPPMTHKRRSCDQASASSSSFSTLSSTSSTLGSSRQMPQKHGPVARPPPLPLARVLGGAGRERHQPQLNDVRPAATASGGAAARRRHIL